ncbi:DUF4913 domain-containing protein [Phaeacidiphilus oryzae]|jgi:hypothetical protein|uniref:DUF4913 domain-containing protein n=1 Tax=Phaeacidiphilus oryzae TaxID=348818 RepID=UPI000AA126AD|nr:DUF4913 domain-containing protein [Phaeacidiphilus oryzae]
MENRMEGPTRADEVLPDDYEAAEPPPPPPFILYRQGPEYLDELRALTLWTHQLLLPIYGREVTSSAPWCPVWWEHPEAVAQLHALWLAWQALTGAGSDPLGPANWHRDYLGPVMGSLRDPAGPFAGCKPGTHRDKRPPAVEALDPFGPPPEPPPLTA